MCSRDNGFQISRLDVSGLLLYKCFHYRLYIQEKCIWLKNNPSWKSHIMNIMTGYSWVMWFSHSWLCSKKLALLSLGKSRTVMYAEHRTCLFPLFKRITWHGKILKLCSVWQLRSIHIQQTQLRAPLLFQPLDIIEIIKYTESKICLFPVIKETATCCERNWNCHSLWLLGSTLA